MPSPPPDFPDTAHPAVPYPGAVPDVPFVHVDGQGYALSPDPAALGGWRVGPVDLDGWLAARDAPPMARRVPVLAYGSNRNPAKISWLRAELGLTGPVVVVRARSSGVAAVWAAGLRVVDDQRPAVLTAAPGTVEEHSVWFATSAQVAVLDVCEGRTAGRYRLARLHTGQVRLENGVDVDGVLAYLGNAPARRPLLVDGAPVRCAAVPQTAARALAGGPAPSDGLAACTVEGPPDPDEWPARLFVYGSLQPGERAWPLLERAVAGSPERVRLPGTLLDTGFGYPGLLLRATHEVPGWLVPLRDPAATLRRLDRYEGPQYARTRVALADGRACWTYVWTASTAGTRPLHRGWRTRS